MINPSQPPEGILDPQQPYWPADKVGQQTWLRLKAKLTGRPIAEMSGERHTSYVKLGDADANRLIENIKKYGQYPQVNQNDKYGGAYNAEAYQKWLVEEFLEKPFREQVDKKIEEQQIESKLKEIQETKSEVKEAETKEEVVAVIDDKIEVLEEIREHVAPPRSEYQIPDPWEGTYTSGKQKPKRSTKKRIKLPKSSNRISKKRTSKSTASDTKQKQQSTRRSKRDVAKSFGGTLFKAGKSIARMAIGGDGGGTPGSVGSGGGGGGISPQAAGEGPSVMSFVSWFGGKVKKSFQDAKEQKERALEAQANGAELPEEIREPGYFIKKSIGYHFGGRAFETSIGAFISSLPSKRSKSDSKFADQFDYGEQDPAKKKDKNTAQLLGSGFKLVTRALVKVNGKLETQIKLTQKLISETTRSADILEEISKQLAATVDIDVNNMADEESDSRKSSSDVNIGDINLDMPGGGGLDWFDILQGLDDIRDLKNKRKRNAGQRTTTRKKPRITGDATPSRRWRMPRRLRNRGGIETQPVRALVGEAGPELIRRAPRKMASGGTISGGVEDIRSTQTGIGYGGISGGELRGFAQPLADAMEIPVKVSGGYMVDKFGYFLSRMGPLAGVFAPMFEPFIKPLARVFGVDQNLVSNALYAGVPSESRAVDMLSDIFSDLGGGKGKKGDKAKQQPPGPPGSGSDFWTLAAIVSMEAGSAQHRADVAQSVYNRLAEGSWGKSLTEILTGENQYEPAFNAPGAGNGINPLFKQITDIDSAAAAVQDGTKRIFRRNISIDQAKQQVESASKDITNPSLQAEAATFIGNKTDFRGYDTAGAVRRPDGGNYFFNETPRKLQGPAPIPTFASQGLNTKTGKLGRLLNSYIMEGPMGGYRIPLRGAENIEAHGKEQLKVYERGIAIRPIETPAFSATRNPRATAMRNAELDKQIGEEPIRASWGVNLLRSVQKVVSGIVKGGGSLSTRGVRAGFTGMGPQGFSAIMGGANFKNPNKASLVGKGSRPVMGHGAYSAPTAKGASRYMKPGGGIVNTIVPKGAVRSSLVDIFEPQSKVNPATFDKGKLLADKLMRGEWGNSPLANKLRQQLLSGSSVQTMSKLSGLGRGQALVKLITGTARLGGKALGIVGPLLDLAFPDPVGGYDQISGPNAYYNNPKLSPAVRDKLRQQAQASAVPQSTTNTIVVMPPAPAIVPMSAPSQPSMPSGGTNKYQAGIKAMEITKARANS